MTREEALRQAALEEIAREELEAEQEWKPQQNFAPTMAEMAEAKANVEPDAVEAVSAGWVEGIPFLKDGVAAIDGISQAMEEGEGFDEAYDNYKEELQTINQDLSNAEEQAPIAYNVGEISGMIGSFAAGGAAVRGTQAGAALTKLGQGVVAGAGVGAASELSRSRDRGIDDLVYGATVGAVAEFGGHYAFKGLKKTGKYFLDKAGDVKIKAVKKLTGMDNATVSNNVYEHLKRTGQKESDFFHSILTKKMDDGLVVDFKDSTELMKSKVSAYKNKVGHDLGRVYSEIDEVYKVKVNPDRLKSKLHNDVVEPMLLSNEPNKRKAGERLAKYVDDIGKKSKALKREITEKDGIKVIEDIDTNAELSLKELHTLQVEMRDNIQQVFKGMGAGAKATSKAQSERKVAAAIGTYIDDILNKVPSKGEDTLAKVKSLRKDYGNFAQVEESLVKHIKSSSKSDYQRGLTKIAQEARNAAFIAAATGFGGPLGGALMFVSVQAAKNPNTPRYVAKGLETISRTVEAMPSGKTASRLLAASALEPDEFDKELHGIIAENNLKNAPIPRDTEAVRRRVEDIRHYIKANSPEMLEDFDEALDSESDEALAGFMDGLSKVKGASKFFEDGLGFNGVVYTEEDKAILDKQLQMSEIPAAQRVQMRGALHSQGIIPDFNSVVEAPPKEHVPRTRKMESY